jgi:hypothetical protein
MYKSLFKKRIVNLFVKYRAGRSSRASELPGKWQNSGDNTGIYQSLHVAS